MSSIPQSSDPDQFRLPTSPASPSSAPAVTIRNATPDDLEQTALWHCSELRLGLFPRLGPRFVRRWHGTFLSSPHGIALIAESPVEPGAGHVPTIGRTDRRPIGYLLGSTCGESQTHHVLLRHRTLLARSGLIALSSRPAVAGHFAATRLVPYLRRLASTPSTPARATSTSVLPLRTTPTRTVAVLSAIVVSPELRSSGAGALLVREFLARCAVAGSSEAELVTSAGPRGATGFYRRLGWTQVGTTRSRDGEPLVRFRTTLPSPPGAGRQGSHP